MSAFIVSHETVNAVVNGWTDATGQPLSENQANALGALLWDMNREAYRQRYREDDYPAEEFGFRRHAYTPAETLKAVKCLRYQCAEGNVPETELYRQLDKLAGRLDAGGLSKTAAYESAPWDFPNPRDYVRPSLARQADAAQAARAAEAADTAAAQAAAAADDEPEELGPDLATYDDAEDDDACAPF